METQNKVETIELRPTKQGYINMLEMIIENSTNQGDVEWAKIELEKVKQWEDK